MYIMSQNGEISVNSTTISSFGIEKTRLLDEELNKAFPEPYAVIAYGKGDKVYRMGVYADKDEAVHSLENKLRAMENSKKTFKFGFSYDIYCYLENKKYEEEKASHAYDDGEVALESLYD